MTRRPLAFAACGLVITALAVSGLTRFSVGTGENLLVGRQSPAGKVEQSFQKEFGSDPIVVAFAARNPTAFYRDANIVKLSALEDDLNQDPRVASAVGPGTAANALVNALTEEEQRILTEYGTYIAELAYLNGVKDSTKLQQVETTAEQVFGLDVLKASVDAETAREAAAAQEAKSPKPTDRVLDSAEVAADNAVANDLQGSTSILPPDFASFLDPQHPDTKAANSLFEEFTAAAGDCSPDIASYVQRAIPGFQPTCRYLLYRALLDLPQCPPLTSHTFCLPKGEWASVLPAPAGQLAAAFPRSCAGEPEQGCSYAILTVRLKPSVAGNQQQVQALVSKIQAELAHGIAHDAYYRSLPSSQQKSLSALGPLDPTECGGDTKQSDPACFTATANAPLGHIIAGAPLLAFGVVSAMQQQLLVLAPLAVLLMLLLLVATFRVRGRFWPLLAAICGTGITLGVCLLLGVAVTPAVLAGVPVLVGLGVDYSVQLVARYADQRRLGADRETAARVALGRTGPTTLMAAAATVAGLLAMALVTGVDGGPFVAVPLIAQFGLVVAGGVVVAWLAALLIALPLAVASDRRGRLPEAAGPVTARRPARTLSLASRPLRVLIPAALLGLLGWALLPSTPVQTDANQLLAPNLPQLQQINLLQDQTGYGSEIDAYLQGQVAGPYAGTAAVPSNVVFQCELGQQLAHQFAGQVAGTTSLADIFTAAQTTATASGSTPTCSQPATASASRSGPPAWAQLDAAASPSPAPASPSPAAAPSPGASSGSASSPSSPGQPETQTQLLCTLRLFPLLSRALVMPIPANTQACPGVDRFQDVFLSKDGTPINPSAARIVVEMRSDSIAQEAQVVRAIDSAHAPAGITVHAAGLASLAASAYSTITSRALLFNLFPLAVVALLLLVLMPQPRRAVLALLPSALAAGWAPLLVRLLGLLPGQAGPALGALNPLTVVMGALIVALGTEFSVVLLGRFYEERGRGLAPEDAAAACLAGTGRAVAVSALTLAAGFAVLAVSGLVPDSLPLLWGFGLAVLLDLALAVGAVFAVMLPLAVAWERAVPAPLSVREGGQGRVSGMFALTGSQLAAVYAVGLVAAIGIVLLGASLSPLCYVGLVPLGALIVMSGAGTPAAVEPLPALAFAPAAAAGVGGAVGAGPAPAGAPARPGRSRKAARRRAAEARLAGSAGEEVGAPHEAEASGDREVPVAALAEPEAVGVVAAQPEPALVEVTDADAVWPAAAVAGEVVGGGASAGEGEAVVRAAELASAWAEDGVPAPLEAAALTGRRQRWPGVSGRRRAGPEPSPVPAEGRAPEHWRPRLSGRRGPAVPSRGLETAGRSPAEEQAGSSAPPRAPVPSRRSPRPRASGFQGGNGTAEAAPSASVDAAVPVSPERRPSRRHRPPPWVRRGTPPPS